MLPEDTGQIKKKKGQVGSGVKWFDFEDRQ